MGAYESRAGGFPAIGAGSWIRTKGPGDPRLPDDVGQESIDRISVKDHGIVGDGSDETTEFKAAIAAAQTAGRTLYVDKDLVVGLDTGTTALTDDILITAPLTIEFGPGATLKAVAGDESLLRIRSGGVHIKGGIFDINGLVQSNTGTIDVIASTGTTIDDVSIVGATFTNSTGSDSDVGQAIRFQGVNRLHLASNVIEGRSIGIQGYIESGVPVDGCLIEDNDITCGGTSADRGINISGGTPSTNYTFQGVRIRDNRVRGAGFGLGIETWMHKGQPSIIGNDIKNFNTNISCAQNDSPVVSGNTIATATAYVASGVGEIEIAGCTKATVVSNTIKNGQIVVNGTADETLIACNTIDGTPNVLNNGVIHCSGPTAVSIIGNRINAAPTVAMWGILVQTLLDEGDFTIIGNTIDANAGALNNGIGVTLTGTGSNASGVVSGNVVIGTDGTGFQMSGTSAVFDVQFIGNEWAGTGTELAVVGTLTDTSTIHTTTYLNLAKRYIELTELAADAAAPAANGGRLYLKDNGAGKTALFIRFPTGAVQQIAIEP